MSDVVDILHPDKRHRFLQVDCTFLMIFLGPYQYLWQSIIWLMHSAKVYCRSVSLLAPFLKTYTIDFSTFVCVWLRICNLQKLMQLNFLRKNILGQKRTSLWVILNKRSCNSHCKFFNFVFELWKKMDFINHIAGFVKI